jgi:hypothetical protein
LTADAMAAASVDAADELGGAMDRGRIVPGDAVTVVGCAGVADGAGEVEFAPTAPRAIWG